MVDVMTDLPVGRPGLVDVMMDSPVGWAWMASWAEVMTDDGLTSG